MMEEDIKDLLVEMFKAQDEYGCGFYNQKPWCEPYYKLREIMGMEQEDD
jgi:hypothetical protein